LSARGARSAVGALGLLDAAFALCVADLFDRELSPQDLDLGTGENKLCCGWTERLTRPDMKYLEHLFEYSDTQGPRRFREEVAKSLADCARAVKALNPEHITIMNGCCAVFATLSTVLCDPSNGYLIPAPYYGGINSMTWLYGGIQPVHVPLFSELTDEEIHPFQLTVEKLEDALQGAKKQGIILAMPTMLYTEKAAFTGFYSVVGSDPAHPRLSVLAQADRTATQASGRTLHVHHTTQYIMYTLCISVLSYIFHL
ncbi:LOW QUALITY PROTEIN: 1-aminocyclopropane-1-carboxylate synthase-like protein 1, partial [Podargus strigoides]